MPVFMKKHLKINDNSSINIKIGIWNMETETIINDEKETKTTENNCNGVDDQSFSNDCKDVLRTKCKLSKAFSIIGAIAGWIAVLISGAFSLPIEKKLFLKKNTYSPIIILVISIMVSFISHLIIMIIFISYKVEKDNKNNCSIYADLDFGASFILCCFCLGVTLIAILVFIINYKSIKEAFMIKND